MDLCGWVARRVGRIEGSEENKQQRGKEKKERKQRGEEEGNESRERKIRKAGDGAGEITGNLEHAETGGRRTKKREKENNR
ncbi:hypothetical protein GOBAR_AA08845 [Gossypium barbadense]|uniref:Uncharacterized protein n=1 Tax=Gossypium barbadense TaxID=3634 RepID=A0A2P5Y8F1_GOSBA|nr:hypothetical protein GOBAR_AA08845 [Gossypium barbadense]